MIEMFALEEDVWSLIFGSDAVGFNFGVLGVEDLIFFSEGLGAEQVIDSISGVGGSWDYFAAHD